MRKILLQILYEIINLFGRKKIVLNASDIDAELLENFEYIGDYKRVLPIQTTHHVNCAQTGPNLSKEMSNRRDIYAPPINSFPDSSSQVCLPQTEVIYKTYKMKNSFSDCFYAPRPDGNNESEIQNNNFVYVKKNKGFIKNWKLNDSLWNDISFKECIDLENNPSVSTYFNMHNLNNEEKNEPTSVLLIDLYMS
jgi:hypothetical protein